MKVEVELNTDQIVVDAIKEDADMIWKNIGRTTFADEQMDYLKALIKTMEYYGVKWMPPVERDGMSTIDDTDSDIYWLENTDW